MQPTDQLPGVHPAPNIQAAPDVYEIKNKAVDPDRLIEAAMWRIAPWQGKIVVDLGAGAGFHFWQEQGFTLTEIESEWRFERREDLEAVVHNEFPEDGLAEALLAGHQGLSVPYVFNLYSIKGDC